MQKLNLFLVFVVAIPFLGMGQQVYQGGRDGNLLFQKTTNNISGGVIDTMMSYPGGSVIAFTSTANQTTIYQVVGEAGQPTPILSDGDPRINGEAILRTMIANAYGLYFETVTAADASNAISINGFFSSSWKYDWTTKQCQRFSGAHDAVTVSLKSGTSATGHPTNASLPLPSRDGTEMFEMVGLDTGYFGIVRVDVQPWKEIVSLAGEGPNWDLQFASDASGGFNLGTYANLEFAAAILHYDATGAKTTIMQNGLPFQGETLTANGWTSFSQPLLDPWTGDFIYAYQVGSSTSPAYRIVHLVGTTPQIILRSEDVGASFIALISYGSPYAIIKKLVGQTLFYSFIGNKEARDFAITAPFPDGFSSAVATTVIQPSGCGAHLYGRSLDGTAFEWFDIGIPCVSPPSQTVPLNEPVTVQGYNLAFGTLTTSVVDSGKTFGTVDAESNSVSFFPPGASGSDDSVTVAVGNVSSAPFALSVGPAASPRITAVFPSTFTPGDIAVGGFMSGTGNNFCVPGTSYGATQSTWPNTLGGIQILVDGQPVPLEFVGMTDPVSGTCQFNAQLPWEISPGQHSLTVVAKQQNGSSMTSLQTVFNAMAINPSFFTAPPAYPSLFLIADEGALMSSQNPAHPGDTIVGVADGFGPTNPAMQTGTVVPLPSGTFANVVAPMTAWVNDCMKANLCTSLSASVVYGIAYPGSPAGYQVAVTLPQFSVDPTHQYTLGMSVGGVSTPSMALILANP